MNTSRLRGMFGALATLLMTVVAFGQPHTPTPQQALEYATSVVLVQRIVKDNQVHTYVKEVWRFDPNGGPAPEVGAEYREPMRYDSRMQHPERDGIAFTFAKERPKGLPTAWTIPVMEDGTVTSFEMNVAGVRSAVKKTKPKA